MSGRSLLGLLLLAGAAFMGLAVWQVRLLEREGLPAAKPRGDSASGLTNGPVGSLAKTGPSPRSFQNPNPSAARPAFNWKQVESEDYRSFLNNLRQIGCPDQTVRDIVSADLMQSYAPKRAEVLAKRYEGFNYWSATPADSAARSEFERKRREIDDEMTWAMKELLGDKFIPPSTAQEWKLAELDQQLSALTPEKRTAVRSILAQYADTEQQVRNLANGQNLYENTADRLQVLENYDRKRTQLQALLTPEEYQFVEMTTSWTADNLRRGAVKFNPTPAEFQILFQEWQAYDEMLARLRASGQNDPGNLQEPMQASLRQRLGEQRAQEFWNTWWR